MEVKPLNLSQRQIYRVYGITAVIANIGYEYYCQQLPDCRDRGIHLPMSYSQNVSYIILSV